jgi:hypothetical protein
MILHSEHELETSFWKNNASAPTIPPPSPPLLRAQGPSSPGRRGAQDGCMLDPRARLSDWLRDGDVVSAVASEPRLGATYGAFALWCSGCGKVAPWWWKPYGDGFDGDFRRFHGVFFGGILNTSWGFLWKSQPLADVQRDFVVELF